MFVKYKSKLTKNHRGNFLGDLYKQYNYAAGVSTGVSEKYFASDVM